jgi:hypothetical protein
MAEHGHKHKPGKSVGSTHGHSKDVEMLSPLNAPKDDKGSPESPATMGLPPFHNIPDPLGICPDHGKK